MIQEMSDYLGVNMNELFISLQMGHEQGISLSVLSLYFDKQGIQ